MKMDPTTESIVQFIGSFEVTTDEGPGTRRSDVLDRHDFGRDFDGYEAPDVPESAHKIVAVANTAINQIAPNSEWLEASVHVVAGNVARVDAITQVNALIEHDMVDDVVQAQPSLAIYVAAIAATSSEDKIAKAPLAGAPSESFVERLWRTIKYEEVYLRAYAGVSEARASISRYLGFYNSRRPHSSLDGQTPDQAYFNQPMPEAAAA